MTGEPETIPANPFDRQWAAIGADVMEVVERVGASGWYVLGQEVEGFERAFAAQSGVAEAVGCGNGLDAIEIGLRALGLVPGDRVLTTPLSAFATSLGILRAGGVPCFVDVDDSGLLDLAQVEEALRTHREIRFLLPVHLYGHALNLELLENLRKRFDLLVVEDCAQAVGAKSNGVPVGSVGQAAATSFYPTKNLGCMGDGGAVLTKSSPVAQLARSLRDYGQTEKFIHAHRGLNSRLDEVQAAMLQDAFLPILTDSTKRRVEIAARYNDEIRNPAIAIPPCPEHSDSVWHLFPITVSGDRESFRKHLGRASVDTAVHYPTLIPSQDALSTCPEARALGPLPKAIEFARKEVSLPIHPLMSDTDVERVIDSCKSWRG